MNNLFQELFQSESQISIPQQNKSQIQNTLWRDYSQIEIEQEDDDSNENNYPRYLFPKCRQFIFNGVLYYNLGEDTNLMEFCDQFISSDHFQVRQIEKKNKSFSIQIIQGFFKQSENQSTEYEFEQAFYILQQSQNSQKLLIAQLLLQLQGYCTSFKRHIELVNIYYDNNQTQLKMIKQLRIEQMKKLSLNVKQALFANDDYVITTHFSPVFQQKIQSIEAYEINLPFVSILGTTEDEFISISMRNGFQCWLSDSSCEEFQNQIIKGVIDKNDIVDNLVKDQELITLDGIVIKCNLRFILVKNMWDITHPFLPVNLKPSLDYFVILKYDIDESHIQSVSQIRKSIDTSSKINALTQSLSYSIQSEIFFDKFYQNEQKDTKNEIKLSQTEQSTSLQSQNYSQQSNTSD